MLMRRLLTIVIGSAVAYIALQVAIFVGDTWQIQANPWAGVEVTFDASNTASGTLSRAWTGEWVLTSAEGEELRFTDFESMSFENVSADEEPGGQWREWLPPGMVVLSYMLWLFAPLRIPANVTTDSGMMTTIPVIVTAGRCCAF